MSMQMPDDVYATLAAVVQKFPHTGTDDERRDAMEKVVQTIRARFGHRWVWKTEHVSLMAPSKDGLGYVPEGEVVHGRHTSMFIWDTISGGTRQPNRQPLVSEEARMAYVLTPEPKDWLGTPEAPAQPQPQPPAPQAPDLAACIEAFASISATLNEMRKDLADLKARQFPHYEGKLGYSIRLEPKP